MVCRIVVGKSAMRARHGFTLIELIVVMAIVATLAAIVWPRYIGQVEGSQDVILRENLRLTRLSIDKFHEDLGRFPDSLQELVDRRYIRTLPVDPVTGRTDTWLLLPPPSNEKGQVGDLKSGASGSSRWGIAYTDL
jgi:general secretion pathway protein G